MKRITTILFLILSLCVIAQAQIKVVDEPIFTNTVITDAGTATSAIIALSGQNSEGLFPDSVYVIWDANGDTNNIELRYAKAFGSDVSSYTLIGDTITAAQEMTYAKLAYTVYAGVTGLKIKYTALTGNAVVAANKTKLTVKLRKFYTLN